jgi:hypothetical protein
VPTLDMQLLGTIEPDDAASAGQGEWIALIGKHSSLAAPLPKQGINPFTKQPHLFEPAKDHASVVLDGGKVGAIHWAMDGSHRLIVWSAPGAISHVTDIALDVASRLKWRFIVGANASF